MRSPVVLTVTVAYLGFAFAVVMSWYIQPLDHYVPRWLAGFMYPIDKINLDVLRFAHFIALAVLVVRFAPADSPAWKSPWLRPVTVCGEHSLEIFCLGVFLSFTAHFILVEISGGIGMQILMSAIGIALMTATAALITWYKTMEKRDPAPRQHLPDADIAGGDV